MTGGGFTPWNKAPTEVRPLSSHRHWETGALFYLMTSKRWLPGPSETSLDCKTVKLLRFTPQRDIEKMQNPKFCKVNSVRKGRSGSR